MPTFGLHESQIKVFQDPSRFRVLVAGRRFGKTYLALVELLYAARIPNVRCWYVGPTYRQAEMVAWKMLLDMIPVGEILKKDETKLEVTLKNHTEVALKGADNEDSLRGAGVHFLILDEYAMMKPNVWQEVLRPCLTDTRGRAMFIGTPKGKNSLFDLYLKGQRNEDGYSSYRFKTVDNPYIDPREVEEAKTQLSERYFRQEYEASFEDYVGLVWPEFSQALHVIDPIEIPAHWETFGAVDTAVTGITGVLFSAIDEKANIFITGEYYKQDKRVSEIAPEIRDRCKTWYGDPEGRARTINRNGYMFSLFDEYLEYGIALINAQKEVSAGINRVAEYMKNKKLKVFSNCKNLISELERYHWSEEKETSSGFIQPKPYKANDHLCDCLRYLIMSRYSASVQPKEEVKMWTPAWIMEQKAHAGKGYR